MRRDLAPFDSREDINQGELTAGQERLRAMVAGDRRGGRAGRSRPTPSNHAARTLPDEVTTPIRWRARRQAGRLVELCQARPRRSRREELELSETDETAIVHAEARSFQDGDAVGVVVVLNDVSRSEGWRIRRDFVANVSHELKTSTNIRGTWRC